MAGGMLYVFGTEPLRYKGRAGTVWAWSGPGRFRFVFVLFHPRSRWMWSFLAVIFGGCGRPHEERGPVPWDR